MLQDPSAQDAIVRFTWRSEPADGCDLLPSCWKGLKRRECLIVHQPTPLLIWWRWRESNPRPKIPPLGVYKLSAVF